MKVMRTLAFLFLISAVSLASQSQTESSFSISPAQNSERSIGLHETHVYEFSLKAGELVRFDVAQINVDPHLIITDAQGRQLREMYFERMAGKTGISFIAAKAATFRLKFTPSGKSRMTGSYRLEMSIPRPAEALDHERIKAQTLLNGEGLVVRKVEGADHRTTSEQRRQRLVVLQQLSVDWQRLNEPIFESETWYQIGLVANRLQRPHLAQTAFEKLLLLARANQEILVEAVALNHLAALAANRGEEKLAEAYLVSAIALAKQSGAKTVEASISSDLGSHYYELDHYEKARAVLQQVVAIHSELGNAVAAANARVSLAATSTKFDQTLNSTAVYQEALAVFEKHNAFPEKSNVLRNLGGEAAHRGEFELANKYFNEALALAEKYAEPKDEAFILYALGLIKVDRDPPAAERHLLKALERLRVDSDLRTEAQVWTGLAKLDAGQKRVSDSIAKLEKALEIANKLAIKKFILNLNAALSVAHLINRNGERAAYYMEEMKRIGQTQSITGTIETVEGSLELFQGDFPTAIEHFEKNIKFGEQTGQTKLVFLSYQRLGGILLELNDLQGAENAYRSADNLTAKIDDMMMKRPLVLSMAELHLRQNKLAETKQELEELLDDLKQDNDNESVFAGYAQQLLGRVALKEKNYILAQTRFSAVLNRESKANGADPKKTEVPGLVALALHGLGDSFAGLGKTAEAQEHYGRALLSFRVIDSPTGEAAIFETLMHSERKAGNLPLAIFYGKQAVNALQPVRRAIKPLDAGIRRNFLSSVESAYRTLAATLLEKDRVLEAHEVLSLLKEEEFYQFTRRSRDAIPINLRLLELNVEEDQVRQEYQKLTDDIKLRAQKVSGLEIENQRQPLTAEKLLELDNLKTEITLLTANFLNDLKDLPTRFSQTKMAGLPDASKTQTRIWQKKLADLGPGKVLLTTLVTENRYYVVLTTPDKHVVRTREISLDQLDQQIRDLRDLLEHPSSLVFGDPRADVRASLIQDLYEILVKPIEADLLDASAETLLWSLDGILRYVPLAVLHDGQGYFVERYTNLVVTLAEPPTNARLSPATWRALAAGVSNPMGADPLPQVALELRAIVRDEITENRKSAKGIFAGRRLLNEDFSRVNLAAALRQNPQLVHLATHFSLSTAHDMESFLLLGDDDRISLAELRTEGLFDLNGVQLMTLSACETGKGGNNANGVEIESLGVIAQRRGARTVLASLLRVDDDATRRLMTVFYQGYKNAKGSISKAEALRQAQMSLLKSSRSRQHYSHPAYWGAFIMLGSL